MGATLPVQCPVEGCNYSDMFRFGMGEETSSAAYAERQNILLEEHPEHGATPVPAHEERAITDQ